MHHTFFEILKRDLENLKIFDINNVQAMIIYNIGDKQISIGELTTKGLYNGSNISYNLKKLVQSGYLIQAQSSHDKRTLHVKLSEKGLGAYKKIDKYIAKHVDKLDFLFQNKKALESVYKGLVGIESFWNQNEFLD
jgi:DNA-binding MarR family transcriptional regulator